MELGFFVENHIFTYCYLVIMIHEFESVQLFLNVADYHNLRVEYICIIVLVKMVK